jgi:hypothetical protein
MQGITPVILRTKEGLQSDLKAVVASTISVAFRKQSSGGRKTYSRWFAPKSLGGEAVTRLDPAGSIAEPGHAPALLSPSFKVVRWREEWLERMDRGEWQGPDVFRRL